MGTTTNVFWNQLNVLTGLPDLRRINDELKDNESLPTVPKDFNSLLDEEYKKSIY
jgi:hypothetical protein